MLGLLLAGLIATVGNILGGTLPRILTTVLAGAVIGGAGAWAGTTLPSGSRSRTVHCGPYCEGPQEEASVHHVRNVKRRARQPQG